MGDLLRNLRIALEDWDVVRAETEINKPENRDWLEKNSWDVIPLICGYLTPELETTGPHLTQCCQELLVLAAKAGSPKENLVAILEQIDAFRSVVLVRRVLPALGIILLNIKDQSKSHSWDWGLDTLSCHFKTIPAPANSGLEGKERLTLDLKPETVECLELLDELVLFLEPLVAHCLKAAEVENLKEAEERELRQRRLVLNRFILCVLGRPLAYLPQHPELTGQQTIPPRSHRHAVSLVGMLAALTGDMLSGVLHLEGQEAEEHEVSVGTYLYLVLAEEMHIQNMPQVYSSPYLLRCSSSYIIRLLSSPQEMVVLKGLLLLHSLLQRVPEGWLTGDSSDNPDYLHLLPPLVQTIVYNELQELRTTGFQCFKLFVNMFDVQSRYNLYKYLFNTLQHSGLFGWTVTHFKDTLATVFKDVTSHSTVYSGDRVCRLLNPLFELKHGVETDLLEISDELIAEINLAFFLTARCPDELNEVKAIKPKIKAWTDQIQEGLKLSKAHWELKVQNDSSDPELSVMVGGQRLPSMEPEQMQRMTRSALTTLDIIHFNLVSLLNRLD